MCWSKREEVFVSISDTMAKVERFKDLQVWQLATEISRDVWHLPETTQACPAKNTEHTTPKP